MMPALKVPDSPWRSLYRIAAPATLAMTVFFLFDTVCWIVVGPLPRTAEAWYALVVFSLLMLRSTLFGSVTAHLGILGHGLDLTRITMNLAFVPEEIGAVLLMIGGLSQLVWLVLVARKFMRLGWPPHAETGSTAG